MGIIYNVSVDALNSCILYVCDTTSPSLPRALILPRLGYPSIYIYSNRESPGNPREFPKIKEKWCKMQGTIPRILITQLKQVLVFDIILNVLLNKAKNILETYH